MNKKRVLILTMGALVLALTAGCKAVEKVVTSVVSEAVSSAVQSQKEASSAAPSSQTAADAQTAVIENQVDLSLDKSVYAPAERVEVTLDFGRLDQSAAVIVLVPTEREHGSETAVHEDYAEYRYLSDFSELPFYLWTPDASGLFDVRVYENSDGGKELASITIAVGDAKLPESGANTNAGTSAQNGGTGGAVGDSTGEDPRSVTQQEMEATIVSYLSKISSLQSLTLCDGSLITYDLADWFVTIDLWIIENPTMSYADLQASMNAQLTAAGLQHSQNELGSHLWTVDGKKGIELFVYADDDESYMIRMTMEPEAY